MILSAIWHRSQQCSLPCSGLRSRANRLILFIVPMFPTYVSHTHTHTHTHRRVVFKPVGNMGTVGNGWEQTYYPKSFWAHLQAANFRFPTFADVCNEAEILWDGQKLCLEILGPSRRFNGRGYLGCVTSLGTGGKKWFQTGVSNSSGGLRFSPPEV